MNRDERVALVTGASSGFGMLTSIALAKNGYYVIATMRDPAKQSPLLALAEGAGIEQRLEIMQVDVTVHESIDRAVGEVIRKHGRIDVLVNNAGYAIGGYVEDVPMEAWKEQLETNVFGVIAAAKAVLPHMRAQASGCIINLSSVSGLTAYPGFAPYSTSKFAIEGFSESLRLEMKPYGVRVVLVEPGAYRTDIWSKGFAGVYTTEASPYWSRLSKLLQMVKQTAGSAPDPQEVADAIVSIAGRSRPKLRYPLGRGVRLGLWSRSLLPWKWYEAVVLRMLR
ncbi:SDR family oxidoreductase [Paenibacillus aestuarii]|uniref:SDR family oxidoreductase n=1 Tax=Paenibacillus aestuarii TaxID=516965 RepID=A0ABW0KAJ9_9BACL|nr:SDR family oxidoreductase [Paenibacillus aestuarii]